MKDNPLLKELEEFGMKYDECYSNSTASDLFAKARTNCLEIEELYGRGERGKDHDTACKLCKEGQEDITNFMITCKKLEPYRDKEIIRRIPNTSDWDKTKDKMYIK